MMEDQIKTMHDLRAEFRDECNAKARLGDYKPAVNKSLEEETREIMQKVADGVWLVTAGVQAIVNLYADKGPVLLPFTELRGPRLAK